MFLSDEELFVYNKKLGELIEEISCYTVHNMKRLFTGTTNGIIGINSIAESMEFVLNEVSRIQDDIHNYPHLNSRFLELYEKHLNIHNGKTYCETLFYIARLDIAMKLGVNQRIADQRDSEFYDKYYLPITNGTFKDPYRGLCKKI